MLVKQFLTQHDMDEQLQFQMEEQMQFQLQR